MTITYPTSLLNAKMATMTTDLPIAIPPELAAMLPDLYQQKAFGYQKRRWLQWLGHLEGVSEALSPLPDELDRAGAASAVTTLIPNSIPAAFTVSMIWGHGTSHYGPYRTACILTGTKKPQEAKTAGDVTDQLTTSVEVARRDGAVAGFRYLNRHPGKVVGLGPAFFTKWLYFITTQGDPLNTQAAPVLDRLVIRWLGGKGVHLRPGYTADYDSYVALLRAWGDRYKLGPAAVEERIFGLIRSDSAN